MIATRIATDHAQLGLGKHAAAYAESNLVQGSLQGRNDSPCAITVPIEQMKSNTLRRLRPDARQTAQRSQQVLEERRKSHAI